MAYAEAIFRFSTGNAEKIYRAIQPELSDEVNTRSVTSCRVECGSVLVLTIEAQDTAALRAALNMTLRLVNVADEMQQVIGTSCSHAERTPADPEF
jgi:KEOPS complex subunit Pcc1